MAQNKCGFCGNIWNGKSDAKQCPQCKRYFWNKKSNKCPRCKGIMSKYPAISRRDNKTKICSRCGTEEVLFDFVIQQLKYDKETKGIDTMIKNEKSWLV